MKPHHDRLHRVPLSEQCRHWVRWGDCKYNDECPDKKYFVVSHLSYQIKKPLQTKMNCSAKILNTKQKQ